MPVWYYLALDDIWLWLLSGTWVTFGAQISDEMAEEMVTMAYESGINVFDTAEVYAAGKYVTFLR